MSDNRLSGRYNLHRLGWAAFEDLCVQVLRVALGETCTRFRPGRDQGRDGWFRGQASKILASQNQLTGDFVVQCKHTSRAVDAITLSDLTQEKKKVADLAASNPCNYLLMSNRQLTAQNEAEIRQAFQAIPGVKACLVLGETWIEDTLDAEPRLLRLVPRLYGIGDLSQIISFVIQEQTKAVLDDLATSVKAFVPTESYRRAERALHDHGFVVLVGPPASGKSAIAANLCMVSVAQNADVRILRIEHADQFKSTWSPADPHTIYWVDDVFGETTLDEIRLQEWSAALEKVEAARKRGAKIIFCTRDYILTAAHERLKKSKTDLINDARVRVDVAELSVEEKDAILYNYIKDGDIDRAQKSHLKRFLPKLARLLSFSPELARRLGLRRFNQLGSPNIDQLNVFFGNPVGHFRDVIHGLSSSETAALAVCLMSNNLVPDPIPDDSLSVAVLQTYNVSMQEVRRAFELLEGSLIKRLRKDTKQVWQFHHPSMIEALQQELSSKSSQMILYLKSARLYAVLRDTTTLPDDANRRLVFLPESVYVHLIERFHSSPSEAKEAIAQYITNRASEQLLLAIQSSAPDVLDRSLRILSYPEGQDYSTNLAVRLSKSDDGRLWTTERQAILVDTLKAMFAESGSSGFLTVEGIEKIIPNFVREHLQSEIQNGFQSIGRLRDWFASDLSEIDHVDTAIDCIKGQGIHLKDSLEIFDLSTYKIREQLQKVVDPVIERLQERRSELEEREEQRAELRQDEMKEEWNFERWEMENGRFSDVDE